LEIWRGFLQCLKQCIWVKKMISILILTYNEGIHIQRCLDSVQGISNDIIVIDSLSSDDTKEICLKNNIRFYEREFLNQAETLNWTLDNIDFKNNMIFRIDADEYLTVESKQVVNNNIFHEKLISSDALYVGRNIKFMDKLLKFGGLRNRKVVRILDKNRCRYDSAEMDERVQVSGIVKDSGLKIIDENLNDIEFFINKHIGYANREVRKEYIDTSRKNYSRYDTIIIFLKKIFSKYNNIALVILYFFYRYVIQLGFMDGKAGFYYHFYQVLFYRFTILVIKRRTKK